jgi:UDP-N-acetylmuramate--alanine ligase
MKKLNVGVFMGGRNTENEVSFNSGRTICDHLDTERFNVIPIFQTFIGDIYILPYRFLHRGKICDFEHRLKGEAQKVSWDELKTIIDFAYLAVHGRNAEDGTLQGMLEVLNIPYLGSKVLASAICMDKIIQRDFLQIDGINIPNGLIITNNEIIDLDAKINVILAKLKSIKLMPPYIVKPHKEGSSLGITKVTSNENLATAIYKAAHIHPSTIQPVVIEEFIDGMEFSCIIIDDKNKQLIALPPTEVVLEKNSTIFDYTQKYMPGRATKHTPARCSQAYIKKIQDTCCKVKQVLGIDTIARIDGFLTKQGKVYIIDPNSLSGMGPTTFLFLQAAEYGISHTELINHLIDTELHHYGIKSNIKTKKKNMIKQKIKIGVLLGGNSNEREISLESGRNIIYKLSPNKYEILPIFVNSKQELYHISQKLLVRNSTAEIEADLDPATKILWSNLPKTIDFAFIGLHGGIGENGSIQGALETLNIPYNGSSVFASALCINKYKTNQLLTKHGFNTPKSILINKNNWLNNKETQLSQIDANIPYPIIIKPHDDGCSVMVQKATNKNELDQYINNIFNTKKEFALIEEMVTGMELTVGVIGNDNPIALPPSQAVANKGILSLEEKFLPGAGENQTPALLPNKALKFVQQEIAKVFKTAHCRGYARIDCFYQNALQSPTKQERIIIIEINTLPGMTPATCIFHQAAEISIKPMEFIE